MSVDSRLREGLERSAASFVPTALDGAEAAVSRARRRRTARRVAGSAAVVVVLAIGAVVVVDRDRDITAPSVPAAPVTSPAVTAAPTTSPTTDAVDRAADAALAAGITGEWTTGVVSVDQANAAMVRTGTSAYRETVLADLRVPGTFTLTFDELAYRARLDGEVVDVGTWYVSDGRLGLVPTCDRCSVVLGPRLEGGVLTLSLLDDASPDYLRVPDAAFAAVLWTSAPFHRP